jgi:integrase/recombinase XerD
MTEVEPYATPLPAERDEQADLIRQLVHAWLLAQDSDHTKTAYRRDIAGDAPTMKVPGWLVWCDEQALEPLHVRRVHIDAYKDALRQANYSPATISRRIAVISSFYQYAADEEIIEANHAKAVKRPKIDSNVSPAVGLTEDELDLLLEAAASDSKRSAAIINTLYFSGLRVGSLIGADVGDLGWNEGERTLKLRVKGGSDDYFTLEGPAADAIDVYLAERGSPARDEPLILSNRGERIDQAYAWRLIRSLARGAGIKSWDKLGPHSLRHTMATHALDANVPLADVQDALRHRDPKTTRRYDLARLRRNKRAGKALVEQRRKRIEKRRTSSEPSQAEPLPHEDGSVT